MSLEDITNMGECSLSIGQYHAQVGLVYYQYSVVKYVSHK